AANAIPKHVARAPRPPLSASPRGGEGGSEGNRLRQALVSRGVVQGLRPTGVTAEATHKAIEAVFRIESAKIIAGVARMVRDVGVAEELAQDALVAALETWPDSGVPDNPGAWLMTTAKNRALDRLRQRKLHADK